MEWRDVAKQLTGQAHIATVRPDGSPHVAKVWPGVEGETIWIASRAGSGKVRNLRSHPHAAVMWEPTAEVYLSADAEVVADTSTKARLWNGGVFPYPMEGFWGSPDKEDWVLLRLTPTRAIVMSQGESGLRRDTWEA